MLTVGTRVIMYAPCDSGCTRYSDSVNMSAPLAVGTKEEIRAVIRWSEGVKMTEIHCKLKHSPYSPALASSDFHMFGPLKKALQGRQFSSGIEA